MSTTISGLDIMVGYNTEWVSQVSTPTPDRIAALKGSARAKFGQAFGWINGPPWDMNGYAEAAEMIDEQYRDVGYVKASIMRAVVDKLLAAKAPKNTPTTTAGAPLPGMFSTCYPNENPPPFQWRDGMSFPLMSDGVRAAVIAEESGGNETVPLDVFIRWHAESH